MIYLFSFYIEKGVELTTSTAIIAIDITIATIITFILIIIARNYIRSRVMMKSNNNDVGKGQTIKMTMPCSIIILILILLAILLILSTISIFFLFPLETGDSIFILTLEMLISIPLVGSIISYAISEAWRQSQESRMKNMRK